MIFSTAPSMTPRYSTAVHEALHESNEARTRVLLLNLIELMHAAERKTVYKRRLF